MENIAAFRECHERWAGWIGASQEKMPKNTIWRQCTEMMNNEFMFQALLLAGKKAASLPDFHSYLAANSPLYRYLLDGYLSFQYLAIRRLMDRYEPARDKKQAKGVASLYRLLNDMEAHSELIAREAFVCVDGLPYDYTEALESERTKALEAFWEHSEGEAWLGEPGIGTKSRQRHLVFDRLSGVAEDHRQPTDTIAPAYWQQYRDALAEPELSRIKNFVDKYLAHAADEQSIATLDDEDKKQSMQRIHHAQHCLISLVQRLALDFYGTRMVMVPTDGEAQLLCNFSKPFVSSEIAAETFEELRHKVQERFRL
ncbi:MAG: hypothetical protein KDD10_23715 [Phaeodactylibacter sp.]|nr:hypothetical protein [Phaeodactylibacter sp.]